MAKKATRKYTKKTEVPELEEVKKISGRKSIAVGTIERPLPQCSKCGSTDIKIVRKLKDVTIGGINPITKERYSQVIWHTAICENCKQHQTLRTFVNKGN